MHPTLKALVCGAALAAASLGSLQADDTLRKAQQSLRDQGFYYGKVDGSPGDETTQAIRRYQIRNGLAVTGQLNDETIQSIGKTGGGSSSAAPRPKASSPAADEDRRYASGAGPAPAVPRRPAPAPPVINGEEEENNGDDNDGPPAPPGSPSRPDLRAPPEERFPSAQRVRPSVTLTNLLEGTPFEFAPPPVQSGVVRRAQISLLRGGFFGGEPDGIPGRPTTDALAEFQSANGLRRTGRLDEDTLDALRLLPPSRRPALAPRGYPPVFEGRIVR